LICFISWVIHPSYVIENSEAKRREGSLIQWPNKIKTTRRQAAGWQQRIHLFANRRQ
jgi:hypothetical protein